MNKQTNENKTLACNTNKRETTRKEKVIKHFALTKKLQSKSDDYWMKCCDVWPNQMIGPTLYRRSIILKNRKRKLFKHRFDLCTELDRSFRLSK